MQSIRMIYSPSQCQQQPDCINNEGVPALYNGYTLAPLLQKDCDTKENKGASDISDISVETAEWGTCDASLREDATSVIA